MSPPVPRIGRILDGLGALVFLAGVAVYGRAWWGLRRLQEQPDQPPEEELTFAALERFVELQQMSRTGLVLMAVGAAIAIAAALVAARLRRKMESSE
ncbi:MAG: hypothetical protein R3223_07045 [Longimicrobiales bacterium]|nr:hypothetical protein [Longimicrobiales bacterium]